MFGAHVRVCGSQTNKGFRMYRRKMLHKLRLKRRFSHRYQRARYGISDIDTWSLDNHLANVIALGTQTLKDGYGYPARMESQEEWHEILDRIHRAFSNYDEIYGTNEEAEFRRDEVRDGMDLLKEYFFDLWD